MIRGTIGEYQKIGPPKTSSTVGSGESPMAGGQGEKRLGVRERLGSTSDQEAARSTVEKIAYWGKSCKGAIQ